MSVPDFLDSNVLVYAYDASDPEKQRVAQQLLQAAVAGAGVVSTQVIAEFAAVLLHKISPAASPESVTAILDAIGPNPIDRAGRRDRSARSGSARQVSAAFL